MGFEDVAGESGGGDDEGGDSAELEVDDGAELAGELGKGVVGHVGEEVEVADDGELGWGGGQFVSCRVSENVT